jgi:PadR family transcriptional regulator AphA
VKDSLTTTSYVVLGHLATRPWAMYDLASHLRRNVHFFYPRAESGIYQEPKRLVELGLARVKDEGVGKRPRSVYSITPAGRRVFKAWLDEPVAKPPQLEFEGLLRAYFAPHGSLDQLTSALGQVQRQMDEIHGVAQVVRAEYLAGVAPEQQYVDYRALVYDFLWSFGRLVDQWSARSQALVDSWPSMSEDERRARTIDLYERHGDWRADPTGVPTEP